jgi:drug/metabolite transporter (DMT)-like permease
LKKETRGLIGIHTAVLLFGLAGLFGKFLDLPAWSIVLGRTVFAAAALGVVIVFGKAVHLPRTPRTVFLFAIQGVLLAVHWITFFHAIQVSSVAVGLLAFSTFPVFITLLEPWWFNETPRGTDVVTALMVVAGLGVMVAPEPVGGRMVAGVLWGGLSGFTFAVLSLLNRQWAASVSPVAIAFYQNGFAALSLAPMIFIVNLRIQPVDLGWLALLGVVCTAAAHALFIHGLKTVRAQLAAVIACLEPVYGIALAHVLLNETPTGHTLCGGAIILLTTIVAMLRRASV